LELSECNHRTHHCAAEVIIGIGQTKRQDIAELADTTPSQSVMTSTVPATLWWCFEETRGAFARHWKSHACHAPSFIDSRGRILRAPVNYEGGAMIGAAVSSSIARGPIKVIMTRLKKT
jgi:hypothetical protein